MVVAWTSSAAATHRVETDSHVTLAQSAPFHGEVLSKRDACERDRTVKGVDPGPDGLYDTTKSNAEGKWSIPAGIPHVRFYAAAKQRSMGTAWTTLLCKRVISPKVTFF